MLLLLLHTAHRMPGGWYPLRNLPGDSPVHGGYQPDKGQPW